uniref:Cadherin-10 n=1 Tax=Salarias fasciatus TaxID=181472 RepID=A0A672FX43_SALFA
MLYSGGDRNNHFYTHSLLESHQLPKSKDDFFLPPQLHSDGDRGDGSVKYILTGDGAGTLFKIDEKNGDIHATKRLDREEKAFYLLHAKAINRFTNEALEGESEFIIKIHDINDNEPRFTKDPYIASVPEMSDIGTSVIQVTATDADDATYGNSARVVYSILEGQPYFSVDPETGLIKTALANMDREVKEHYQVVIQAKDMAGQMGGLSGTTTVSITLSDVNDNPPRFTKTLYEFRVNESIELGSTVGVIRAMDADVGENAEMEYRIMSSDGPGMFDITTNRSTQEGVIVLRKPLDFERKRQYSLRIQVENVHINPRFYAKGPFRDDASVKILVEDVDEPPVFEHSSYTMKVREDAPRNKIIGSVNASDPDDKNWTVRYGRLIRLKSVYHVPVVISDGELPVQSSTNTLTIRVCTCDREGNMKLCNAEALTARAGLSTGALVAILLCVIILLSECVIVVLFAALRRQRKKEPLIISKEDVRDNVVSYNDEGGGEEDTQAFDIGTLRNPEAIEESKQRRDIVPETFYPPVRRPPPAPARDNNGDVRDFINQRLQDNDSDPTAPPYDSLATYAYEGSGSVAESLSSLESATTEGDQDYNYLSEWGPRFKKLADMYGGDDSDRDS